MMIVSNHFLSTEAPLDVELLFRFILETKVILTLPVGYSNIVFMQESPGLPSISAAKSGSAAVDTRQEQRLHIAVPVKVFPDLRAAGQSCCTYEISMLGARLASLPGIDKVGQVIWIQRLNRRAKYKVIWIGEGGTSHAGQVGVESMEPGNVIWENEIKARIMSAR